MNVHAGKIEVRDEPLVLGTEPIPAKYYYDPDWYELERKAVWMRTWLNVGHVCELPEPGSFIRRELEFAKASILIVRGKDGEVRAFHNACTHRGTQLTDDTCGKQDTFSCRYHMWTFGTDGALLSAPDFERFDTTRRTAGCKQVAVRCLRRPDLHLLRSAGRPARWLGPMGRSSNRCRCARATHLSGIRLRNRCQLEADLRQFPGKLPPALRPPAHRGSGGLGRTIPSAILRISPSTASTAPKRSGPTPIRRRSAHLADRSLHARHAPADGRRLLPICPMAANTSRCSPTSSCCATRASTSCHTVCRSARRNRAG